MLYLPKHWRFNAPLLMGSLMTVNNHLAKTSGGHLAKCANCECLTGNTLGACECLTADYTHSTQGDATVVITGNCGGGNSPVAGTYVIPCGYSATWADEFNVAGLLLQYAKAGFPLRWRVTITLYSGTSGNPLSVKSPTTVITQERAVQYEWTRTTYNRHNYDPDTCDASCDDQFDVADLACVGSGSATKTSDTGSGCGGVTFSVSI